MAEPRYKVVNGDVIELTAEEITELEERRAFLEEAKSQEASSD